LNPIGKPRDGKTRPGNGFLSFRGVSLMSKMKISNIELEQLVREGLGVSEIARKVGVSKGTVSKRLKALNVAINQRVVLHDAGQIVEKKLDAIAQLQKINDSANELLDLLMAWGRGDQEALQILESQVRKVKIRGSEEEITEYKFKDPRELALKAMAEIRGQLNLQLEIFKCLYDMAAVAEFQKEVLESIKEVAPDVRDKIVFNLQKRRAIRSTLELH
jgi:AcrR family transcriptional regulator